MWACRFLPRVRDAIVCRVVHIPSKSLCGPFFKKNIIQSSDYRAEEEEEEKR